MTVPPPQNGSHADGVCGSIKDTITISYSYPNPKKQLNLTFSFIMVNDKYHMDSFSLIAELNVSINGELRNFFKILSIVISSDNNIILRDVKFVFILNSNLRSKNSN